MRYHGGKNGSGVYQRIISMMPPHDTYIEAFLGSGAILRRKRPAKTSYAFELSEATIREFIGHIPDGFRPVSAEFDLHYIDADRNEIEIRHEDVFPALKRRFMASSGFWGWNDPGRTLIYFDPPYPRSVRKSGAAIYEFELMAESEHAELLSLALAIPCRVMISGYQNDLYDRMLKGWRKETINTINRGGARVVETVWLNFAEPAELHDYRYLGNDFHDRLRIKRKAERWIANLRKMPANERYAVFGQLTELQTELKETERVENEALQKRIDRKAARAERAIASPAATIFAGENVELFPE